MGKSPLFSKNKTDTKMVRRNASDKLRLIQMVHDNPILWDSRLPNFKGAEEEKSRAWQIIGNEFSVPGRRVARAFKSLRESYRRELAHVKMMGVNFQPKWSLFMPMDFLRDVIRERKNGAAHMLDGSIRGGVVKSSSSNNNNNSSSSNNNNNNNPMKCHNTNINHPLSLNVPDDYSYFVKPETQLGTQQQHPQQQQQQQPPSQQPPPSSHSQHLPDSRTSLNTVTSTHNDSGGNNASAFDDMELSPLRSEDTWDRNLPSRNDSDEVEELEAIDADFPYPLILENPNSPMQAKHRRKANEMNGGGGGGGGGAGDYEGQMMHQHRHQQQQHHQYRQSNAIMPEATSQTIREVLNSKFCGFISAKLNSMDDAEADNLMNKILMLLVQTQVPASQMNGVAATDGK